MRLKKKTALKKKTITTKDSSANWAVHGPYDITVSGMSRVAVATGRGWKLPVLSLQSVWFRLVEEENRAPIQTKPAECASRERSQWPCVTQHDN